MLGTLKVAYRDSEGFNCDYFHLYLVFYLQHSTTLNMADNNLNNIVTHHCHLLLVAVNKALFNLHSEDPGVVSY